MKVTAVNKRIASGARAVSAYIDSLKVIESSLKQLKAIGANTRRIKLKGQKASGSTGETLVIERKVVANKISPNARHHLANYDGYERAKGIKGAHNQEEFLKAVDKHSNDLVIIDSNSEIKGITQYRYGYKKQDRAGNYTGEVKEYRMPKTVYDPNVFTDEKMYQLGSQAANKGYSQAIQDGKTVYTSSQKGIDFHVYLDRETKEISNFHPK